MTFQEWFRALLNDATASNRAHIIARLGAMGLKPFYEGGSEPSVDTILKLKEGQDPELWRVLCEQIKVENDPAKILELCQQVDRLLEEKQQRQRDARKGNAA